MILGQEVIPPQIRFLSYRPDWDYNMAQGKKRLQGYHQTLLAGLKAEARKLTNMSKVYGVRQGPEESPAAYLEELLEAFHQCTLYKLET